MKRKVAMLLLACTLTLGCAKILASWPTIISVAGAIANLATVQDPALAGFSQVLVKELQNIQTLYQAYVADKTSPATKAALVAAIQAIQQNLPVELAAAHIKDPALIVRVTAAVNLILDFVDSIAVQIPQTAAQTKTRRAARGAGKLPPVMSRSRLLDRWDSEVCQGDASCVALLN